MARYTLRHPDAGEHRVDAANEAAAIADAMATRGGDEARWRVDPPDLADDAVTLRALLVESAARFREYEAHHRAKKPKPDEAKAERNREIAERIEIAVAVSAGWDPF